jgi:hypothetical protein
MFFPGARPISRRELLRGAAGAAIALPFLDAMALVRGEEASKPPVRLVWIHTESGMWMPKFKPTKTGRDFDLTYILEPLAPFKSELSILSGLFHQNAFKRNPQAGRHSQDGMCHLTGADLAGTPGVSVRNTVSVDQLAAEAVGERTRLPSLGFTVDRAATLSYTASGTPVPAEWDPQAVFDQLFGGGGPDAKKRAEARFRRDCSVLDDVMESTRDLSRKLGAADRQKLDAYLSTVREVERRARVARAWADKPAVPPPPGAKDPGPPPEKNRTAYVRVLLDMLVLALQTDQTRFATARIGFMGCQYPDIGCPDGYHGYTHHDFKKEKQEAMARVDRHRLAHLAYFLGKLKAVKEGDHDLLYNCLVHYGTGMGADHETTDLANLLIGRGGGTFTPAGHVDYKVKPLANLYVRMLKAAGVSVKRFANSTGPIDSV